MAKFCANCGAELRETSKFCMKCGTPLAQSDNTITTLQNMINFDAPFQKGEFVAGDFSDSVISNVMGAVSTVRSAAGTVSAAKKKGGVKAVVAILLAIVMAALWIVQMILMKKGIDNPATKILNYLTFARGGLGGGILNLIGGTIGKGVVATAIISLIGGGAGAIVMGIKGLFSGKKASDGQKGNIFLLLFGAVIAVLLYWFFNGKIALAGTMAAISGVIVSLRAIGSRSGIFYSLVSKIFSKNINGTKVPGYGAANSLMRGFTLGFTMAIALAGVFTVVSVAKGDSTEKDDLKKVSSSSNVEATEDKGLLDSVFGSSTSTAVIDTDKPWKNSGMTEPEGSSWDEPLRLDDGSAALYDGDKEFVAMIHPMDGFDFYGFNYDHGIHFKKIDDEEVTYKVDMNAVFSRCIDGTAKEYYENECDYRNYSFESRSIGKVMNGCCEVFVAHETYDWSDDDTHAESYYLYTPYHNSRWDSIVGLGIEFSDPFGHDDKGVQMVRNWTDEDWLHAAKTIFGK